MSEFSKSDPSFSGAELQTVGRAAMNTAHGAQQEVLQDSAQNYNDGRNEPGNSVDEKAQSGQESASQTDSERNDPAASGDDSGSGGDDGDAGGSDE